MNFFQRFVESITHKKELARLRGMESENIKLGAEVLASKLAKDEAEYKLVAELAKAHQAYHRNNAMFAICSREEFARRQQCESLRMELAKVSSQRDEAEATIERIDKQMGLHGYDYDEL